MIRQSIFAAGLLAWAASSSSVATDSDPCRYPDPFDPTIRMVLERAQLGEENRFVGTFKLENRGDEVLKIPGTLKNGIFQAQYPATEVEYLSLNGQWSRFVHLPGS